MLAAALGIGACSNAGNTNISAQTGNNANAATIAANSTSGDSAATPAPATETGTAAGSPSDVYKTAHIARQKKDIGTLKKIFSKDVIEFFTEMGKVDNKSLDDMLRKMVEDPVMAEPEVRNEKIAGDTATVEYKDDDGSWKKMDFVKEDGAWKMTIPRGGKDEKDKDKKDEK